MRTTQKQLMTRYSNELDAFEQSRDQRARKQASRTQDTLHRFRAGWEPTVRVDRKRARRSVRIEA